VKQDNRFPGCDALYCGRRIPTAVKNFRFHGDC